MHLAVCGDQHSRATAVVAAARLGQRSDGCVVDTGVGELTRDVLPAGLEQLRGVLDVTGSSEVDRHERAIDRIQLREGACVDGGVPSRVAWVYAVSDPSCRPSA